MSWLNFNEGLNSLKGQITNFAQSVLTEEDNGDSLLTPNEYEELKKICLQQEQEIAKLRKENEENRSKNIPENESWSWVNDEETSNGFTTETTEVFKKEIERLQNENKDLIAQLEQLDSDNQQNVSKLMEVKHNLQTELEKTKESYNELKHLHSLCLDKEKSYEEKISDICSNNETELAKQREIQDKVRNKYEELLEEFEKVSAQLAHTKNDLGINIIKQDNHSLAELEKTQKELEKSKQEIIHIQSNNEKDLLNQKEIEEHLKKENKNLLEKLHNVTTELSDTKNKIEIFSNTSIIEKERILKELEQSRESYSAVEELYHITKEKEKQLQEELNNCKKLHKDELNKLENECNSKYQNLLDQYESASHHLSELEKINSFKLVSTEDNFVRNECKTLKTNCEELTDCDLQESTLDNTCTFSEINDGYSILKSLFESYINNLNNIIKTVNSLSSHNNSTELLDIKNELKFLEEEIKCFIQKNELIHSKYSSSEIFRDHIDSVVVASLKECNNTMKEEIGKSSLQIKEIIQFTREIRKIFEDFKHSTNPSQYRDFSTNNPELIQLNRLVSEIYDFMYELKSKVILLSDSNINIISEKNQETERLSEKCDELAREILEKSQTIKEYENELAELSKNNDLLIADLEVYKNNHLETISEIDEDKTILLEEQLENANARINDLQIQLESFQEYKDQSLLNISDSKIEEEDNTYLELLNKYDELQVEYDIMKKDYAIIEKEFQTVVEENRSLKSSVDSLKANSENLLYLQDELKTLNESLQADIEMYKEKIDDLVKTNNKLKTTSEENEDLKTEINTVREKLKKEEQIRTNSVAEISELTEKLKLSKMTETSLKLQYDTLSKEFSSSLDTINKLEDNLSKTQSTMISYKKQYQDLETKNEEIYAENKKLKEVIKNQEESIKDNKQFIEELEQKLLENMVNANQEVPNSVNTNSSTFIESSQLENKLCEVEQENTELKEQLETLKNSQTELIQLVTTKHQENIAYHNEIQRLNQILNSESQKCKDFEMQLDNLRATHATENQNKQICLEKLKEENMNLKEQCDLLTQSLLDEQAKFNKLLEEKSSSSETEISLKKKLERLQTHLIELEEHYTSELYEAEQKNLTLQTKVNEIEEREKSSSTMYTSVSIRANQQVESLQNQLQAMTNERDSLRKQISDLEDTINKQTAALTNLQLVLEQFRKDKEKEVHKETERLRRQINTEKKTQDNLKNEIVALKSQLEESKQGLSAAARLSDQLENSRNNISALKEEVSKLQNNLASKQEELNTALSQTDGKVDKSLIKNLVIGFVISNNNLNKDQTQILKIIGTVLDFNQQDHDKLKLNKGLQGSWLSGLLLPQTNIPNTGQDSLSRAFIEFLEKESKPRVVPSLLSANGETPKPPSSRSSTPQSPANLSEIVLPTFADFAQNRNSSSILKDVLKDNS